MIIQAERSDKAKVVELLSLSFKDNRSVRFLTGDRTARIRRLMDYAFEVCFRFGQVLLTEKKDGCALVVYPNLKRFSFWSLWLDMKLLGGVIGLSRLAKVLRREKLVAGRHPSVPFCYLWFIGVNPWVQRHGLGTELLKGVIMEVERDGLPVYLETSTVVNLPWYQRQGFLVFAQLDVGYPLFCLKRDPDLDKASI